MRRLSGRWSDWNRETKALTEARELRSRVRAVMTALGNSDLIFAQVSYPAFMFLAERIRRVPRIASTRAVSNPMPEVAPVTMAVIESRLEIPQVTCSAVDLDPYPLGPAMPRRYFTVSNIDSLLAGRTERKKVWRFRSRSDGKKQLKRGKKRYIKIKIK